jgi:hypothetical protein
MDGIVTDKEREVIFRKSKELGVPEDECEIILEGMIQQETNKNKPNFSIETKQDIDVEKKIFLNDIDTELKYKTFNSNLINTIKKDLSSLEKMNNELDSVNEVLLNNIKTSKPRYVIDLYDSNTDFINKTGTYSFHDITKDLLDLIFFVPENLNPKNDLGIINVFKITYFKSLLLIFEVKENYIEKNFYLPVTPFFWEYDNEVDYTLSDKLPEFLNKFNRTSKFDMSDKYEKVFYKEFKKIISNNDKYFYSKDESLNVSSFEDYLSWYKKTTYFPDIKTKHNLPPGGKEIFKQNIELFKLLK